MKLADVRCRSVTRTETVLAPSPSTNRPCRIITPMAFHATPLPLGRDAAARFGKETEIGRCDGIARVDPQDFLKVEFGFVEAVLVQVNNARIIVRHEVA